MVIIGCRCFSSSRSDTSCTAVLARGVVALGGSSLRRALCVGRAFPYQCGSPTRRAVWGAAPDTPAMGNCPWNPKMMQLRGERQAQMALVCRASQSLDTRAWHTRAMSRCVDRAASIMCRGSGGRLAPGTLWVAGSARGRARSHAPERTCRFTSGEREGPRPLACAREHAPRQRREMRRRGSAAHFLPVE
jgi:hypothetical protein